jgi:hypothetical protein
MDEDERRHKKLIEAILNRKIKPADDKGVKSFIDKLMSGIKTALGGIWSAISGLISMISGFIKDIGLFLAPILVDIVGKIFTGITGKIIDMVETFSKLTIGRFVSGIFKTIAKFTAGQLAAMGVGAAMAEIVGGGLAAIGLLDIVMETGEAVRTAKYGKEFEELEQKSRELDQSAYGMDPTDPRLKEINEQKDKIKQKQIESNKKYEDEVLTPYFEEKGYKLVGREKDFPLRAIYKNDKGETPDLIDYAVAAETKKFKSYIKGKTEDLTSEASSRIENAYESEIAPKINKMKDSLNKSVPDYNVEIKNIPDQIDPQQFDKQSLSPGEEIISNASVNNIKINKLKFDTPKQTNVPEQIDPQQFDKQSLAPGEEIISNTQINNIKGNKPKQVSLNTPNPRNSDLQPYLKHTSAYV